MIIASFTCGQCGSQINGVATRTIEDPRYTMVSYTIQPCSSCLLAAQKKGDRTDLKAKCDYCKSKNSIYSDDCHACGATLPDQDIPQDRYPILHADTYWSSGHPIASPYSEYCS